MQRAPKFLGVFGGRDLLDYTFRGKAFDDDTLARFVKAYGTRGALPRSERRHRGGTQPFERGDQSSNALAERRPVDRPRAQVPDALTQTQPVGHQQLRAGI
jgi:hypothetical protein